MAKKQSIKDRITAMASWTIKAKGKADAGNYQEAEINLKKVELQGRRLEWNSDGLKSLPDSRPNRILKKCITKVRAATQTALGVITKLNKLPKPEGKTPAEAAAIRKKEDSLKKDIIENIAIAFEYLELARS